MENKEQLIQVLTDSVLEVFSSTLSLAPLVRVENEAVDGEKTREYVASIGLAGSMEGSMALCFSGASARTVVGKMLCCEVEENSQDISDGVGELANILAGGVKTRVSQMGYTFNLSIPTVVKGAAPLQLSMPHEVNVIKVVVECPELEFELYFFYSLKGQGEHSAFKTKFETHKKEQQEHLKHDAQNPEDLLKGLIGG